MAFFNKKQAKEKRKGENLVGKIIYCFLLFAPLLSILGTSAYTIFNKNAYQSYSQTKEIQTSINYSSVVGNEYIINWVDNNTGMTNNTTAIIDYQTITIDNVPSSATKFRYGNSKRITFFDSTSTQVGYLDNITNFTYIANDSNQVAQQPWFNRQLVITTTGKLDNSFEYATEKVENSTLYNWAKNTGTYTVMHQTTQGLGIENTFIPMLMSYWLLISVIYFIYDIALILIWALHRRIHDLGDSI